MKVRSLKCVSFCPIQVFEDFGIKRYNKVRKEVFPYEGGYDMFQLAIIIRLLVFAIFVACVYGGNVLYTRLEYRNAKLLWKIGFVTLYSFFLLLVTYVVWFVFYFGLNT